MIATSALGAGVDPKHVRLVVHIGASHSLIDFAQESGRAGRDGKPAKALTLTNQQYRSWILNIFGRQNVPDDLNRPEMQWLLQMMDFLTLYNGGQCHRRRLHLYLDGYGNMCLLSKSAQLCDACLKIVAQRQVPQSIDSSSIARIASSEQAILQSVGLVVQLNANHTSARINSDLSVAKSIRQILDGELKDSCALCFASTNHKLIQHTLAQRCPFLETCCFR